jgi:hypothetical protein
MVPPPTEGIDLQCCPVEALLESGISGVRLVAADPPWQYEQTGVQGNAADEYVCPSMSVIVDTLDRAFDCCLPDAYLLCWATWPMVVDFVLEMQRSRWRYLSGGAWHKTGGLGIGFHFRGDSEPFLLFAKGKPRPVNAASNAFASARARHSEKPVEFWIRMLEAMTRPGDLVLSVYSGMCPEARAAKATGRRLVGAEIDPERHRTAMGLLAGGVR